MKNTKKVLAILFIVGGIAGILFGFVSGKMSDDYKGVSMQMGHYENGKMVINQGSDVMIGGNAEGVSKFKLYSTLGYALGAIFIIGGVINLVTLKVEKKMPVKKKAGKVIEKHGNIIVIQGTDGKRERLIAEQDVILMNGDAGYFEIRNQRIIGFTAIKK